jgi:hypothetical protein
VIAEAADQCVTKYQVRFDIQRVVSVTGEPGAERSFNRQAPARRGPTRRLIRTLNWPVSAKGVDDAGP